MQPVPACRLWSARVRSASAIAKFISKVELLVHFAFKNFLLITKGFVQFGSSLYRLRLNSIRDIRSQDK